jgi:hypothetical protein
MLQYLTKQLNGKSLSDNASFLQEGYCNTSAMNEKLTNGLSATLKITQSYSLIQHLNKQKQHY